MTDSITSAARTRSRPSLPGPVSRIGDRLSVQVRRIGFTAVAAILAAALRLDALLAPAVAGLVAATLAAMLVLVLPRHRHAAESAGLGLLIAAALPVPASVLPALVPALAVAAGLLLYGRWSDALPLRVRLDCRRICRVPVPAEALWSRLVPGAGHPDDHVSGVLLDFDSDADDAETLYLRFRTPDGLHEEMTLTFLERTPPRQCRYLLERGAGASDLMVTWLLNGTGEDHCVVDGRTREDDLPPRRALSRWFEDAGTPSSGSEATCLESRRHWSLSLRRHALGARQTD